MIKDNRNDPISHPEDSAPERRQKQRAGRGIATFFIIFAAGAFCLYLFIILYGTLTSQ